jgi:hypothetical protein
MAINRSRTTFVNMRGATCPSASRTLAIDVGATRRPNIAATNKRPGNTERMP